MDFFSCARLSLFNVSGKEMANKKRNKQKHKHVSRQPLLCVSFKFYTDLFDRRNGSRSLDNPMHVVFAFGHRVSRVDASSTSWAVNGTGEWKWEMRWLGIWLSTVLHSVEYGFCFVAATRTRSLFIFCIAFEFVIHGPQPSSRTHTHTPESIQISIANLVIAIVSVEHLNGAELCSAIKTSDIHSYRHTINTHIHTYIHRKC